MTDVSSELLRDKLLAMLGSQLQDPEVMKLLSDLLNCGGGVTLEFDDLRLKLIRREGKFGIKKEDSRRNSTLPPRTGSR